jgi:hypothetical protein
MIPFPNEDVTPPVTKIYLAIKNYSLVFVFKLLFSKNACQEFSKSTNHVFTVRFRPKEWPKKFQEVMQTYTNFWGLKN